MHIKIVLLSEFNSKHFFKLGEKLKKRNFFDSHIFDIF